MGEVYKARDVQLGRSIALKVLSTRDSTTSSPEGFAQEARAASALSHPNVCHVYLLGVTPAGQQFIAMEYVAGETLRKRLTDGPLTIRHALDIAIQIASALSASHAVGVVHRDVKPDNVMLTADGLVKVLDFGLAKMKSSFAGDGDDGTTPTVAHTSAGMIVGTVAYMSPEQARGQAVDARTDIWSLGVMLYEMVAGRRPFAAPSSGDALAAILQNDPAPLARFAPDTPAELQRILQKTLRKDRSQRYQTVQDLLLDLQALSGDLHAQERLGSASGVQIATGAAASESSQSILSPPWRRVALTVATALVVVGAALEVDLENSAYCADSSGVNKRTGAAQPDGIDVRTGAPNGCDVVARRHTDRLRGGSGWQFRHLGSVP